MRFLFRSKWTATGMIVGAVVGYMYYQLIGCNAGSCHITSQPLNSKLYGAMMGWLLVGSFGKDRDK